MLIVLFTSITSSLFAQSKQLVSGNVSTLDNTPLPGVSVIVKGTTVGVVTDVNGHFAIEASSTDILVFSFIGMASEEVPVGNQTTVDITMMDDIKTLSEVVIVGYGTQKKSHLTGAISKVEAEILSQMPVSRVDDALIGRVSGVNIQATNAEPGAAPTINIRGVGSVNGSSGPAVVVDGVVVSAEWLGSLDMNNVASFEVLKDAASAAIYGSEGSNGVIMITTKNGKEGNAKFSYETYFGRKDAFGSDGYRKPSVAEWAEKERAAEEGVLSNETLYALQLVDSLGVDRDWQDIFFDGGNIISHSLSARGGSDKTKFSTSLRYLHDEGVVITDDYKLYSANAKVDSKLSDKLKFGINVTPAYSKRRVLPTSIHNGMRQATWLPIYHTEKSLQYVNRTTYPNVTVGDYFREDHLRNIDIDPTDAFGASRPRATGDQNGYAQYVEREHYEYQTNLLGSTYLSYSIIKGLTAKTSLGATLEQRKRTRYDGTQHHAAGASRASYNLQNRYNTRLISDNTLDYSKTIGSHELNALAGATFQRRSSENSSVSGNGFSNDLLKNLQGATLISEYEEVNYERTKIGYFARVNYAFADKYLVSASFRRDGSSVFGIDSKWGNFPAISAGWNVHNENFFTNNIVSTLKLRSSYGFTGNENFNVGDDIVNNYPYLALLNTANAVTQNGISAGIAARNVANTLLQWEASKDFSSGVDFGFLEDRITGSLNYYVRTSDKLLLENPVSYITGFSGGIVNLGEVRNKGFELELSTLNATKGQFRWKSILIASTNKNELINFGESDGALLEDTYGRNSQWINSVGHPISSFYGYVVDRELPNKYISTPYFPIGAAAEDIIVKDLNGDGLITDEDKTILGDPYPDLIWSFTNEFQYRNFDFSFMLQGSQGAEVRNVGDQYFFGWFSNPTVDPQQAVTDGEVSDVSFIQEKVLTDLIVQPAGYLSLRNVNLGYNFTKKQLSKVGLENLRIYVSGQNLIYQTSDKYFGFNPEFVDDPNPRKYGEQRAGTPIFKTVSIGLNVNF